MIRPYLNKTPYEFWKDRKPNIGYFKNFGCKCFILNTKDSVGKFDLKFDIVILFGYSNTIKDQKVYNKKILVAEEFMHVIFDESSPSFTKNIIVNNDVDEKLQKEESSNYRQDNAICENQEERQEKQTNMEQNEGNY